MTCSRSLKRRELSKTDSKLVLKESGTLLPMGSAEFETCCFNIYLSSIFPLFLQTKYSKELFGAAAK